MKTSLCNVLAFSAALACSGLCAAQTAPTPDAGLRQCRSVAEAQARLACYDALPLAPPAQAAVRPATAALTAAPVAPAAPAVVPAVVPTPVASPQAERFGLDSRSKVLQAISSSLPGPFAGWGPNTRFALANGQVWQVADGSSAFYVLHNPKVTVRKAFMSGFEIEIEGVNQVPRVRRVP